MVSILISLQKFLRAILFIPHQDVLQCSLSPIRMFFPLFQLWKPHSLDWITTPEEWYHPGGTSGINFYPLLHIFLKVSTHCNVFDAYAAGLEYKGGTEIIWALLSDKTRKEFTHHLNTSFPNCWCFTCTKCRLCALSFGEGG